MVTMEYAALAIFVSILLAQVGGFAWLIRLINDVSNRQTESRHESMNRLATAMIEAEERLTKRIERLEDWHYRTDGR